MKGLWWFFRRKHCMVLMEGEAKFAHRHRVSSEQRQ